MSGRAPGFAAVARPLLAPLLIWAAHFAFVYGFVGLACARGWARPERTAFDVVSLVVFAATAAACAGAIWSIAAARGLRPLPDLEFLHGLTRGLGLLALVAMIWEGAAIFIVPACR